MSMFSIFIVYFRALKHSQSFFWKFFFFLKKGVNIHCIFLNELKIYVPNENLHANVYTDGIHNCQTLEAAEMPFDR